MDGKGKKQKYSVGYKKPPKHTQFRAGQSGNPKGRPKKVATVNEVFMKELQSLVSMTTSNGKKRKISVLQAIAKRQANLAVNGDPKAARLVLDQLRELKPDSGDNIGNLIMEFREVNARHKAADNPGR
jgi:hypothetical protein